MAQRKAAPARTLPLGRRSPRFRFFLNPYVDARFATCPQCNGETGERKLPLVIHVEPRHLLALNMTCRFCERCDLLIAHQDELESLLAAYFSERDPDAVGNDYLVAGTMDHADWERGLRGSPTLPDMLDQLHEFAEEAWFEPAPRTTTGARAARTRSARRAPRQGGDQERPEERQSVPLRLRPTFDAIVERTDAVCREHLNDEYAQLCRRLAAALCRKRPSPVTRGKPEGWACGIAYAIGAVNFLFDKSQTPHHKAGELCKLFGVSPATGAARASEIRKLFGMYPFDPAWCLPSLLDENPLVWMIEVNGIPFDVRYAPLEVQEEALRRGLIPYLPKPPATR